MEMGDHYAFADLRQLIAGRTAALFPTEEQFNIGHRNLTTTTTAGTTVVGQQQHYEMLMLGNSSTTTTSTDQNPPPPPPHQIVFPLPLHHHHHHRSSGTTGGVIDFCSSATHDHDHSTDPTTNSNNTGSGGFCGLLEMDNGGGGGGGGYMHMINNIGISGGGGGGGGGGGTGGGGGENVHNNNISRWPRQETLSLLEIRSHLDPKFKEANQKGPLWDEVSRIMAEEHGYQRSGKKCREKFENLYKYYKKTKEGKAGRQDGKHYRFFRQLEALYGETNSSNPNLSSSTDHQTQTYVHQHLGITTTPHNLHQFQTNTTHTSTSSQSYGHNKLCESLSLSNSSEFDTSSSEDNVGNDVDVDDDIDNLTPTIAFMGNSIIDQDDSIMEKRRKKKHLMKDHNPSHKRGKRSWKTKIRDFVDSRMKKLMETQEAWLEKMLKTLEHKEQERVFREEEWRKQETARVDREHKFWAKERAWFEARDAALMDALQRFTGTELKVTSPEELMATEVHENSTENHNDQNGSCQNVERSDVYSSSSTTRWSEAEISSLIQLKSGLESKFQQCAGSSQEALWEDISVKMASLGYHRSAKNFQEKWESIDSYFRKTNEVNKKRRENSRASSYNYQHLDHSTYSHQVGGGFQLGQGVVDEQGPHEVVGIQLNDGPSPSNSNAGTTGNDHCFRFLMNEGENLWENYGMKLNKGGSNNQ